MISRQVGFWLAISLFNLSSPSFPGEPRRSAVWLVVVYMTAMAIELRRKMKPWIEVAPLLLSFPRKCSNAPKLETIEEEGAEEYKDENDDE